ncbi:MAG: phosphoglucosamine mutase, partial [candidate division Zixibacteria bacterium]|nr:phosphoglucosamine mutase [candidate division Zixibacteria bacterium]
QYKKLDRIFNAGRFAYRPAGEAGTICQQRYWVDEHVRMTLKARAVTRTAVKKQRFKIVVDAINGAGSTALPQLLRALGVSVIEINCKGDGNFVHEPEPIPANLTQLSRAVRRHKADLGMACDPDADRLALVDEKGRPIGEELTLTIAVKQVLSEISGPTVINLSTSKVTADVAAAMGSKVHYAKVGEANVVETMHRRRAVIGGEGNGGVIYPSFHAGRDALIAAALVLSRLATEKKGLSGLVETLPTYYTIKSKARLPIDFKQRLSRFEKRIASGLIGQSRLDRRDGLRFDFDRGWLQIRSSNTEPIFRLMVETDDLTLSRTLSKQVIGHFK